MVEIKNGTATPTSLKQLIQPSTTIRSHQIAMLQLSADFRPSLTPRKSGFFPRES